VPLTRDLLDQTLPAIDDVDLETLIDQRATSLVRAIEIPLSTGNSGRPPGYSSNNGQSGRAQIAVQFFEKKRKKTYFFGKGDEEVCWEQWTLDVTCATPRTESGTFFSLYSLIYAREINMCIDRIKVRQAMEKSLQKTAMKIVNIVNRDKDHIPPITVAETNPFPYQILVNPKSENWSARMGIF